MLHELAHTRVMNHSQRFWDELATLDPARARAPGADARCRRVRARVGRGVGRRPAARGSGLPLCADGLGLRWGCGTARASAATLRGRACRAGAQRGAAEALRRRRARISSLLAAADARLRSRSIARSVSPAGSPPHVAERPADFSSNVLRGIQAPSKPARAAASAASRRQASGSSSGTSLPSNAASAHAQARGTAEKLS